MDFKKQIAPYKNDMIRATQDLVRIRSVKEKGSGDQPFGQGMAEALDYVLNLAEELGFTVKNLEGYCGYAEYGEGDLHVGVISHVDTCDEGEMWAVEPFGAKIIKNRIYGRGTMDNKGPLIAALYALKAVRDSGQKINKKVRFIIGTDEERYYEDMHYYLAHENPPIAGFTLDGQFPVVYAEKGLSMMEYRGHFPQDGPERIAYIRGGTAENSVPGYCKAFLLTQRKSEIVSLLTLFARENRHNMTAKVVEEGVIIESFGMETHSMALEMGINAISPIIRFLTYLKFGGKPVQEMISFIDESFGFDLYGKGFGIQWEDEFSGKLTVNFGILSLEEDEVTVRFDVRYPVTCSFKDVAEKVRLIFNKSGFAEVENTYWEPVYFPREHFLIKALLKAYRQVTKDFGEPIASGSGSYSKIIPNIAAFGAIFPGENPAWHRVNEYIDIDDMMKMAEIYAAAIYELASTL